jgi:D-arabinose 1-dehydrogenase-like Zn-dependent alcohol dehydrogenase
VKTEIEAFPLEEANIALKKFRAGKLDGNAVLKGSPSSGS